MKIERTAGVTHRSIEDDFGSQAYRKGGPNLLLLLFVAALLPPSYFFIGDLRLTATRVLLLVVITPLFSRLVSGAVGRVQRIDIFMMLYVSWVTVTLLYHHGLDRFGYSMITVVELLGGYLIGRVAIRSAKDFENFFMYVLCAMIFLFPFVVLELFTNRNILQDISMKFLGTYSKGISSYGRLGLNRVMAGFEHPILYGLFCSAAFAPLFFILRARLARCATALLFVGFMTFASLSSAPLLAVAIQIGLLIWGWMTGGRWKLLAILFVTTYVVVDSLSNRTPITIMINYISFNPDTAWTRVMTWQFGSEVMWKNPIFGIGLRSDWERPVWLTASVDNFWLLNGMRHGVLGVGLLIVGLISGFIAILRSRGLSEQASDYRTGYLIMLVSLYFTLTTVHVWEAMASFVMLVIGAGAWFSDPEVHKVEVDGGLGQISCKPVGTHTSVGRFSRFPAKVSETDPSHRVFAGRDTIKPRPRHNDRQ